MDRLILDMQDLSLQREILHHQLHNLNESIGEWSLYNNRTESPPEDVQYIAEHAKGTAVTMICSGRPLSRYETAIVGLALYFSALLVTDQEFNPVDREVYQGILWDGLNDTHIR